jgi:hypothetical protein
MLIKQLEVDQQIQTWTQTPRFNWSKSYSGESNASITWMCIKETIVTHCVMNADWVTSEHLTIRGLFAGTCQIFLCAMWCNVYPQTTRRSIWGSFRRAITYTDWPKAQYVVLWICTCIADARVLTKQGLMHACPLHIYNAKSCKSRDRRTNGQCLGTFKTDVKFCPSHPCGVSHYHPLLSFIVFIVKQRASYRRIKTGTYQLIEKTLTGKHRSFSKNWGYDGGGY